MTEKPKVTVGEAVVEKVFFENSQGVRLCGILQEPNESRNEVVILVHGYSTNKNASSIVGLAEELAKRKINSFRIDLDGCGESEGAFENQTITSAADDVGSAIKLMEKRGYARIDLLGSSAGGLAAMVAALEHPEINRIGLKAPVSDSPAQRLKYYGQAYLDEWKKNGYVFYESKDGRKHKVNYSSFEDSKKHVMHGKAKNITCPVLVIHGTGDTTVLIEDSRKLVKELPNGKLVELEGVDHHFKLNDGRKKSNELFGEWFENGSAAVGI
ncbi:MAG: alpha/beta hydrolase [Candidatus Micrarchaeia archaeon]